MAAERTADAGRVVAGGDPGLETFTMHSTRGNSKLTQPWYFYGFSRGLYGSRAVSACSCQELRWVLQHRMAFGRDASVQSKRGTAAILHSTLPLMHVHPAGSNHSR